MDISVFPAIDLQDEVIAPIIIEEYREQVTKRVKDVAYTIIMTGYIESIFQDFESFLKAEVDLVEDDIRLVSNEYNSSFVTYELETGIYTFKDIFEALFNILQPVRKGYHNAIDIENDDLTMKTKLVVIPNTIAIRFDEK